MSEEDDLQSALKSSKKRRPPSIAMPITIWVILLLVGLLLDAIATLNTASSQAQLNSLLLAISNFILALPGMVIMPIVFGAMIGAIAGMKGRTIKEGARLGAIDGVYAGVIYVIAAVVIYLIMLYALPTLAPNLMFLGVYWIGLPIVLAIALSALLGAIMSLRK